MLKSTDKITYPVRHATFRENRDFVFRNDTPGDPVLPGRYIYTTGLHKVRNRIQSVWHSVPERNDPAPATP